MERSLWPMGQDHELHDSVSFARYVLTESTSQDSADGFSDILQRLKIIPRDEVHIDLTVSPPPSPRVKRENGDGLIEHEGKEDERDNKGIKQDALSKNAGRTQRPADLPTGAHGDAREPGQQRDRKRKAMQDELVEVELEHRGVMLEQRKLRLTKALAETE